MVPCFADRAGAASRVCPDVDNSRQFPGNGLFPLAGGGDLTIRRGLAAGSQAGPAAGEVNTHTGDNL
ncbi:hypothetical protein GCM10009712_27590 [Pseudarthrobacter sulfonivorans]